MKHNSRRRGFTLLEVMIAMAILAIGLVTVMQLFAGALRLGRIDRGLTEAVLVAQRRMDELLLMTELDEGFEESGEEDGYSWTQYAEPLYEGGLGESDEMEGQTADFIEQIQDDEAVVPVNVFKLTVTVKWRIGESSNEREYTLTSLKALCFHED
ncbi:type II secretion system protein [bacterium]|nr:type II secretion system protein [bacterium]